MVPAPLNVETDQIHPKLLLVLLEQVLRQLAGEEGVQLLGLLGGQAPYEGLQGQVVVQVVGCELRLSQGDRFHLGKGRQNI